MAPSVDARILLRNIVWITPGHLDSYVQALRDGAACGDEHGPQLMVQTFLDEPAMVAFTQHCADKHLGLPVRPSAEIVQTPKMVSGDDVAATVIPRLVGVLRLS